MASTDSSPPYHGASPKGKPFRENIPHYLGTAETGNESGTVSVLDRRGTRYGQAALISELGSLRTAGRGSRHKTLYRASARMGELVAGGELDPVWARAELLRAGDRLKPGDTSDVLRCVESGLKKGGLSPRRGTGRGGTKIRNQFDARQRIAFLIEYAAVVSDRWVGVTGATELRVLLGVCALALHAGKTRVNASHRQIADAAGVGLGAVGDALDRLEGEWIRTVRVGLTNRSKTPTALQLLINNPKFGNYVSRTNGAGGNHDGVGHECSLLAVTDNSTADPETRLTGFTAAAVVNAEPALTDPGAVLWRRRGNAWRIYVALHAADHNGTGPLTAAALSAGLAIPARTVWRNLRWLADAGLVTAVDGTWQIVGAETAEEATSRLQLVPRPLLRQRSGLEQRTHQARLRVQSLRGWWHDADDTQKRRVQLLVDIAVRRHNGLQHQLDTVRHQISAARIVERRAATARKNRSMT